VSRSAKIERKTKESDIVVELDLDGTGLVDVDTGVPFYDHMLNSLGSHASFDLSIKAAGDVDIEGHHTIEDTAIVLGQALGQALGDKKGIRSPTRPSTSPAGRTAYTSASRNTCCTPRSPAPRCRTTRSSTGTSSKPSR
jgi:Imidazoleglycerol-phosphate dehydratase